MKTTFTLVPQAHAQETILFSNQDGTVYLKTDLTAPSKTTRTTTGNSNGTLQQTRIAIPEGFASTFSGYFNAILSFVMVISALLVFFYLIWGGFDWITSGGDKGKTDKAREKIVAAVIGIIIVAASYAILTLVINFLGFSDLNAVFNSAQIINE